MFLYFSRKIETAFLETNQNLELLSKLTEFVVSNFEKFKKNVEIKMQL